MKQNITVSKTFIDFLYNSFYPSNKQYQSDLAILEDNFIITDCKFNLFKEYYAEVDKLPNSGMKTYIKDVLTKWAEKKRRVVVQECCNDEFELALKSSDKILYSPKLTEQEITILSNKYEGLEIHSFSTFIDPKHSHKLKNCPSEIILEPGETYSLFQIIEPFIRRTRKILIFDPYIPNPKAKNTLCYLLQNISKEKMIIVETMNKESYVGQKVNPKKMEEFESFEQLIQDFRKDGYNIKINYRSISGHVERFICTETFEIKIPGGLDFLIPNTPYKPNTNSLNYKDSISITKFKRYNFNAENFN